MKTPVLAAIIGTAGTIIGALIAGAVTLRVESEKIAIERQRVTVCEAEKQTANTEVQRYRQMYENAPEQFTSELGRLVDQVRFSSEESTASRSDVIVSARTIVAVRNDLRSSLDSVGTRLDNEIDELAVELSRPKPDQTRVEEILRVLQRKWPAKKQEIALAVRKIMTELGIVPEPRAIDKITDPPPKTNDSGGTRAAIERIRKGRYQALPPDETSRVSGGGPSQMTVRNSTSQVLRVYLVGPLSYDLTIPAGGSKTVPFPPGRYEMAAEVSNTAVPRLYGKIASSPGTLYSKTFYLGLDPGPLK